MPPKRAKSRLDERLVAMGLADSIKQAQALVLAGQVVVSDQRADKPSQMIYDDQVLRIKGRSSSRFVSRAGDKLFFALEDFDILQVPKGVTVLDIGSSTGGFTDCCLQLGASKVYALDVGTNQLDWRLRNDERVVALEKTNITDIKECLDPAISLVVADVSFNAIARLFSSFFTASWSSESRLCYYLLLVKPQFELPSQKVDKGGIVSRTADQLEAVALVQKAVEEKGLEVIGSRPSQVQGRTGNQEHFILAKMVRP